MAFIKIGVDLNHKVVGETRIMKIADSFKHPEDLGGDFKPERLSFMKEFLVDLDRYAALRARAVSDLERHGHNGNYDAFEALELAMRYATFIASAFNVDHRNWDPRLAIGSNVDSCYFQKEGWVENFILIDKKRAEFLYPHFVEDVFSGKVNSVSMGAKVLRSVCSICGNIAEDNRSFCTHIRALREGGQRQYSGKETNGALVDIYEKNRGVTFFELTGVTTIPADPDAKILDKMGSLEDWKLGQLLAHVELLPGIQEMKTIFKGAQELSQSSPKDYGRVLNTEMSIEPDVTSALLALDVLDKFVNNVKAKEPVREKPDSMPAEALPGTKELPGQAQNASAALKKGQESYLIDFVAGRLAQGIPFDTVKVDALKAFPNLKDTDIEVMRKKPVQGLFDDPFLAKV